MDTKVFKFKSKADKKGVIREAENWYDVPLSAQPVITGDWPKMPEYMNGRQYFLWMKNGFKEGVSGAIIKSPFLKYDKLTYIQAGDNSRRWGA